MRPLNYIKHFFCNFAVMKVFLHSHPQDVSAGELERDLELLPRWRREDVLAYKFHSGRVLSAKAFLLLKQAVLEVWGIDEELHFDLSEHGKPSLHNHPEVHFNLSHCKHGVMCVVDNHPVGCDIESIVKDVKLDLCNYCMSASETASIMTAENPQVEFTRLWTMKEAVLKLTGDGLNKSMHDLLSSDLMQDIEVNSTIDLEHGYCYSIATRNSHTSTE